MLARDYRVGWWVGDRRRHSPEGQRRFGAVSSSCVGRAMIEVYWSRTSNAGWFSPTTAIRPATLPVQLRHAGRSPCIASLSDPNNPRRQELNGLPVPVGSESLFGPRCCRYLRFGRATGERLSSTPLRCFTRLIRQTAEMRLQRHVVVLDAADIDTVSTFWARLLNGRVFADDTFHCVLDGDGRWLLGVQLAPDHTPPDWPHGNAQQVHLDLHVEDPHASHDEVIAIGARLLQDADLTASEGFQVYADPAGHPFCIGWGHPSDETVKKQYQALSEPTPLDS